jgi:hypothetical protein
MAYMKTNEYHFTTQWKVDATLDEVCEILEDTASLAEWWPSVYLDLKMIDEGDAKGVGKKVELYTKGWLPYTIKWSFEVTESNAPHGYKIAAYGDLEGAGEWILKENGTQVEIIYDWRIKAEKPLFRYFSFLLKPLFSANHHWAMRKGLESLEIELIKRRSIRINVAANMPKPPAPTFPHNFTNNKKLTALS